MAYQEFDCRSNHVAAMLPEIFELTLALIDNAEDLELCGRPALVLLKRASKAIVTADPRAIELATYLVRLSDEKILSFPYKDVPDCWRRLYTDASLLEAMARASSTNDRQDQALKAIERLDLALIVAGAPGRHRAKTIHGLIAYIQTHSLACEHVDRPKKRRKVHVDQSLAPNTSRPISCLDRLPSIDVYLDKHVHMPFIVTNAASQWPALSSRPWSSPSYLAQVAGPGRVVPVEVGGTYTTETWSQRIISFSHFLATIGMAEMEEEDEELYYLAQHDLFRQLPALEDDIVPPDLLYSVPTAPVDMPEYVPPSNERGYLLNAWLGPACTYSPPHTDPYYNCYVQIVGSKWVWIAPPGSSPAMYPFGGDESTGSTSYMGNTSQIDVSRPLSSEERQRFPDFVASVEPNAMQAILQPGDMLFLPPGWWHSLKSLSVSISVSMWY